jgi:Tfp pilus assembly protein PilZ
MEKRRDNRIKKKLLVRVCFEGTTFHSFSTDLSRRGIFIETHHPCPAGKGINIEIDGKNQKIDLAGFIRWSRKNGAPQSPAGGGMGVQLLNYQKPEYQSLVREIY